MSNIMRPYSLVPVFGDLEKELTRVFNAGFEMPNIETSDWQPKVDVIEEAGQFIAKIDTPGVDPKDININFDNNALTIKGEKETEHKEKKDNFIRCERSKGSFYRRIMLPDMVNADKISAKNKDGVLIITIPKSEQRTSRKIEIQN
jgi:HSP20 family protein